MSHSRKRTSEGGSYRYRPAFTTAALFNCQTRRAMRHSRKPSASSMSLRGPRHRVPVGEASLGERTNRRCGGLSPQLPIFLSGEVRALFSAAERRRKVKLPVDLFETQPKCPCCAGIPPTETAPEASRRFPPGPAASPLTPPAGGGRGRFPATSSRGSR